MINTLGVQNLGSASGGKRESKPLPAAVCDALGKPNSPVELGMIWALGWAHCGEALLTFDAILLRLIIFFAVAFLIVVLFVIVFIIFLVSVIDPRVSDLHPCSDITKERGNRGIDA
jgi:hypothetical protein